MTRTSALSNRADRLTVGADEMVIRASSGATGGALLAFDVQMAPGGGPPVLHRHDAAEVYDVRRGEYAVYVEDDAGEVVRRVAGTGDVVAIPGGRQHTIRNESDAEAAAYVVFSPGTEMERFAREADALAAAGALRPGDVLALAERHGIEMTDPVP